MKKRFSISSILLTAVLSVLVTLGAVALAAWLLLGQAGLTIASGAARIHTRFVGEYDASAMADAALEAMVDSLGDRWSYYMDQEAYEAQQLRRSNAYVGVGVTVTYEQDGLHIQTVSEGGPAQQAGLLAGEVITAVDGADVTGDNASQGSSLIQGEAGTQVTLTVRGTDGEERQVEVTRARLQTTSVTYQLLEDAVGYVVISNFYNGCADQAQQAVADLLDQGASSLLFDMRDDPGGYLDELTQLLDYLLPEGVIFRSGDRTGPKKAVTSDESCVDVPMAVLVNENTYSAAELFAAQLQESVGAAIVGQPTFGKGYSQQTLTLLGGGALNLSTRTYYTGAGVSLIGTGVTLDIQVAQTQEGDAQLAAAVDYLTGGE